MENIVYVSVIASLMCAQTRMRPDISFAVSMFGAKKVLRYLQGIKNDMLTYRRSDHLKVIRYKDSDFASYIWILESLHLLMCVSLARGLIPWKSANQLVIVASIMEVEFVTYFKSQFKLIGCIILFQDLELSTILSSH